MPAHEYLEWILYLKAENERPAPSVEEIGGEALARGLGAE